MNNDKNNFKYVSESGLEYVAKPLKLNDVSSQITYRLISLQNNINKLESMPHKIVGDLAKVYYLILKMDEQGITSAAITNALAESWKIDVSTIDELAERNTPSLLPPVIRTMREIIMNMISEQELFAENFGVDEKSDLEEYLDVMTKPSDKEKMFVLSNCKGINGAGCLLYQGLLKGFADKLGSNLYVLPSSTHEVILIPDSKRLQKSSLEDMVKDVNETQVPVNEILSNKVYYYNRETDNLDLAEE